ncbi:hypothetical protein EAS56_24275 [Bradyrhizobium guangzhouense]|uniref:Uncharacterized protein n=2 Tax=Bradyrhizobium guangzhouense TaxID=1325095 RepID=A0AAE6CBN1_9BRAD|nr:hypothetical protein XH91_02705 [Bradyrhizobium guangzhouense]RXH10098.1 hypothetical protein EAS56_24275 [Bradyrhizobium guangzhouense]
MIDFLSGVHAVDLILVIVAAEIIAITLYWHVTRRGISPRELLPNLVAGALLLLALRLSLSDYSWPWYTACLALAGVANVADLRQRWR